MTSSESAPGGGPDGAAADKEDEEARRFILKVKETVERCVAQRMDKEEMFRVIRKEGLPTWVAFAVYKELRDQNHDFFKGYYCAFDVEKQRKELNRLARTYRHRAGGGNTASMAAAPPTAMVTDFPFDMMEWWSQQAEQPAWFDDHPASLSDGRDHLPFPSLPQPQAVGFPGGQQHGRHLHSVANGDLQGVALPLHEEAARQRLRSLLPWSQEAARVPAGQQLHNREPPVANGVVQGGPWQQQQQAAHLALAQQLHGHQFPVANGGFHEVAWRHSQAAHFPAGQQLHSQEQLMANGGLHAALLTTSAAGLPSDDAMVDSCWPLPPDGVGWEQGRQDDDPLRQWWPGASADP